MWLFCWLLAHVKIKITINEHVTLLWAFHSVLDLYWYSQWKEMKRKKKHNNLRNSVMVSISISYVCHVRKWMSLCLWHNECECFVLYYIILYKCICETYICAWISFNTKQQIASIKCFNFLMCCVTYSMNSIWYTHSAYDDTFISIFKNEIINLTFVASISISIAFPSTPPPSPFTPSSGDRNARINWNITSERDVKERKK